MGFRALLRRASVARCRESTRGDAHLDRPFCALVCGFLLKKVRSSFGMLERPAAVVRGRLLVAETV